MLAAGSLLLPAPTQLPVFWLQVEFHFPEPTELPPPLIQAIDVDFKYPGRCVAVCMWT